MKLFRHLWQRIFIWTFLLVMLSNLLTFFLFRFAMERNHNTQFMSYFMYDISETLKHQNIASAKLLLDFLNKAGDNFAWIENEQGELLAGDRPAAYSKDLTAESRKRNINENIVIYEQEGLPALAQSTAELTEGRATVNYMQGRRPPPPFEAPLLHFLIVTCLIDVALTFLIAKTISKPLREVKDEVLEIAGGRLDKKISIRGGDEISELANAVNTLSQNLSNNIKSMQELLANISHELRSPLTRMGVSAAIIEEYLENTSAANQTDGPEAKTRAQDKTLPMKHLAFIADEINHMEQLIGTTLLNSKLDLQRHKLNLKKLNCSELCEKLLSRENTLAQSSQISLDARIEPGIMLQGDKSLLSLVVSNLMDNAIKFSHTGDTIWFRLERTEGNAVLCLENPHPPLSEEALEKIFEPFYRDRNDYGSSLGSGLGLTITKKIVAMHHGAIRARNTPKGILLEAALPLSRQTP